MDHVLTIIRVIAFCGGLLLFYWVGTAPEEAIIKSASYGFVVWVAANVMSTALEGPRRRHD